MNENIEPNEGAAIARRVAEQWLNEAELVPLALIALEVDEPIGLVADRLGEAVQLDDVGMRAVPVEVARRFLTERAEQTARMEEQALRLQEALEPSLVGGGVPALEDGSALASIMAADPAYATPQAEFGRPRPNFLAEELEAGARQQAAARAEAEKVKDG